MIDSFAMLGALTLNKIIDKKLAIETYAGPPALRCWPQLYKHDVKEERKKRRYYVDNYEAFVRLSLDCFKEAPIKVKFYRKCEESYGIDLISELQRDELFPISLK